MGLLEAAADELATGGQRTCYMRSMGLLLPAAGMLQGQAAANELATGGRRACYYRPPGCYRGRRPLTSLLQAANGLATTGRRDATGAGGRRRACYRRSMGLLLPATGMLQ